MPKATDLEDLMTPDELELGKEPIASLEWKALAHMLYAVCAEGGTIKAPDSVEGLIAKCVHQSNLAAERERVKDQPPPVASTRRPVWELVIDFMKLARGPLLAHEVTDRVIADMAERDRVGRERYGVQLASDNGRDHLVDAYQEALDQAAYLAAFLDKRGVTLGVGGLVTPVLERIHTTFIMEITRIVLLREEIDREAADRAKYVAGLSELSDRLAADRVPGYTMTPQKDSAPGNGAAAHSPELGDVPNGDTRKDMA